ncbi:MAG TPA: hypothetical protein VGS19_29390 [Streptosporangiaceae bacterium]|nr:hypothetical protein [Streptosporangiaceae bacterium]
MRRVSVLGLAMVTGACAVLSACGQQPSGGTAGAPDTHSPSATPAPVSDVACKGSHVQPAHQPLTITTADTGKTFCLTRGSALLVILRGTPDRKWSPIHASSTVLVPRPSGELMLVLGATGASFTAARPGTATVTSTRPACPGSVPGSPPSPTAAGNSAPAVVHCDALIGFSATVVVLQ